MLEEKIVLEGAKRKMLQGVVWHPYDKPIAILQITHGMTEHIGRYEKLAQELTAQGILVAGFDLRGHGKNPGDAECASFEEGGWNDSLKDMHFFFKMLEEKYPGLPHYMMGFSLGSFLLREYLNKYNDKVAGAAILGTGYQPSVVLSIMRFIVNTQIQKSGFNNTTPLVQKLSFDTYNQKFAPTSSRSDWLCSDIKELTAYLLDPYCREDISSGLFWQLLGSMKKTGKKTAYDKWNKNMPVLLVSGEVDAVGNFGKGVKTVELAMKEAGMKDVSLRLFEGARHDVLHEEENGTAAGARKLLADWILEKIKKQAV